MACFLVPTAEAVISTIVTKAVECKEKESAGTETALDGAGVEMVEKIPFSHKMKWLNNMLWGGSALLALEHVWHGEVTPWFPFLTAAGNPADAAAMVHEMTTVGVAMAALVTIVWAGMAGAASIIVKRAWKKTPTGSKGGAV